MTMMNLKHKVNGFVIRYKNHVAVVELDGTDERWTLQVYAPFEMDYDEDFDRLSLENVSEWEKSSQQFDTEGEALAAAFDFIESYSEYM